MPTPHIEAKKGDIAKVVLMPGDPLRAKFIATNFLENIRLVNSVRNILAYTGTYKGREITIFSSGMGNPSMGIYSYELFKFYDVEKIIRIGSCGAYSKDIDLYQMILVDKSYSDSNYDYSLNKEKVEFVNSSSNLNNKILEVAKENSYDILFGNVFCTDAFYGYEKDFKDLYDNYYCLGTEMETFALFLNAKKLNREASCILTVSDNLVTKEETSSSERQNKFTDMIILALETVLKID